MPNIGIEHSTGPNNCLIQPGEHQLLKYKYLHLLAVFCFSLKLSDGAELRDQYKSVSGAPSIRVLTPHHHWSNINNII